MVYQVADKVNYRDLVGEGMQSPYPWPLTRVGNGQRGREFGLELVRACA